MVGGMSMMRSFFKCCVAVCFLTPLVSVADDTEMFFGDGSGSSLPLQVMVITDESETLAIYEFDPTEQQASQAYNSQNIYNVNERHYDPYDDFQGDDAKKTYVPIPTGKDYRDNDCKVTNGEVECSVNYFRWGARQRKEIAKEEIMNFINDPANSAVEFGLASFPQTVVEVPILPRLNTPGADIYIAEHPNLNSQNDLQNRWNNIQTEGLNFQSNGDAKICTAYYETYRYLAGLPIIYNADNYVAPGQVYDSPIRQQCQNINVIYITGGKPEEEGDSINNTIKTLTGDSSACGDYEYVDGDMEESCMPRLAKYMANPPDQNAGLDGRVATGYQEARTFTIGFGQATQLLADTASMGKGQCFTTSSSGSSTVDCEPVTNLGEALQKALEKILEGSNSFVSPSVSVNTSSRTEILDYTYLAMFEASNNADWKGNLKKLGIFKGWEAYPAGHSCRNSSKNFTPGTLVDRFCNSAMSTTSTNMVETVDTFWGGTDDDEIHEGGFGHVLKGAVSGGRTIYTNFPTSTGEALGSIDNLDIGSAGLINRFGYTFIADGYPTTQGVVNFSGNYSVGDDFWVYRAFNDAGSVRTLKLKTQGNGNGSVKVKVLGKMSFSKTTPGWSELTTEQERLSFIENLNRTVNTSFKTSDGGSGGWGVKSVSLNSGAMLSGYLTTGGSAFNVAGYSPSTYSKNQIVNWIKGKTLNGSATRDWVLGDIQHSRPVTLNYGDTDPDGNTYSDDNPNIRVVFGTNHGVLHFLKDDLSSTSGQVNEEWAFFAKESLGNIPRLIENEATDDRVYGLDGHITTIRIDANNDGNIIKADGDRMLMFFGMRRGGTSYYGMDVTDPNSAPKLLWRIDSSTPGFEELGQSWSKMVPVVIPGHRTDPSSENNNTTTYKYALAFGAGYDGSDDVSSDQGKDDVRTGSRSTSSRGRGIYVIDAGKGTLIKSITAPNASLSNVQGVAKIQDSRFEWSVAASPAPLDSNGDGLHDRLYVADTGGNVFRIDIGSEGGSNNTESAVWSVSTLAKLGLDKNGENYRRVDHPNDRRFFYQPAVANTKNGDQLFDAVVVGSGNRANPVYKGTDHEDGTKPWKHGVIDRFYMLKDVNVNYTKFGSCAGSQTSPTDGGQCEPAPITHDSSDSMLYDTTDNLIQEPGDNTTSAAEISLLNSRKGWFMDIKEAAGGMHHGEKTFSKAEIVSGVISFTTWEPAGSYTCSPGAGASRAYFVSLQDASAVKGGGTLVKGDRVVSSLQGVSGGQVFAPIGDKIVAIPSGVDLESEIGIGTYSWLQEK